MFIRPGVNVVRDGDKVAKYLNYSVLGAVRGPDNAGTAGAESIKRIITGRIRAIVFTKDCCPGDYNPEVLTRFDIPNVRGFRREVPAHYRNHLDDAINGSRGHAIWGGLEDELLAALY